MAELRNHRNKERILNDSMNVDLLKIMMGIAIAASGDPKRADVYLKTCQKGDDIYGISQLYQLISGKNPFNLITGHQLNMASSK